MFIYSHTRGVSRAGFRCPTTYSKAWSPKESLAAYLNKRVVSIGQYLSAIKLNPKELEAREKIKAQFLKSAKEAPVFATMPANTISFEVAGGAYLREAEIRAYLKDGIVGPTPTNIARATLDAIYKRYTGIPANLSPQAYREARVRQEWQSKDVLDLACSGTIVAKVASLLGEDIKVRFTGIHEVAAGVGSFSSITSGQIAALCAHSDTTLAARLSKRSMNGPFIDLDSINVWVSISGTTAHNAPLYVFPKTHLWPVLSPLVYLQHAASRGNEEHTLDLLARSGFANEMVASHALCYEYLQTSPFAAELPAIRRFEIYTKPGDCLIFSSHLLHGSDTNLTAKPRLALSVRYSRATNEENDDTLKAVTLMYSKEERRFLGLEEQSDKAPILQVAGTKRHPRSHAIDIKKLRQLLATREN